MTQFNYNRNIPFATNSPASDQPNMLTNTNSTDDLIGVDHNSFNVPDGGYHKIIHQTLGPIGGERSRSGVGAVIANFPAAIPGINQVFAANYTPDYNNATADTQLFNKTSQGGVSQLTGDDAETDGWQWVGGILIQWGIVAVTSLPQASTVNFKNRGPSGKGIPFPNNIFIITATPTRINTPSGAVTITIKKNTNPEPTINSFDWAVTGSNGASTPDSFYWFAIGN